jgi:putative AlgH/UPF0301 family transcriptional regulator
MARFVDPTFARAKYARYFVGLILWDADDLENQVDQKAWEVRPADADTVLRPKASGLSNPPR